MNKTDRFAKTIVFCVDQEHADEMRRALNNLNADLVRDHPDYVCRVTSDEGDVGRGHLSHFQDVETLTPTILTTSQLLTTGVDAPTCKNVALARVVGSMTEFKQIIGRGTRVRDDYGKLWFSILDYTGAATRHFADPDFDGYPSLETEETIDDSGAVTATFASPTGDLPEAGAELEREYTLTAGPPGDDAGEPRKFYFDGGQVAIAAHLVFELDASGRQLRVVEYAEYAAETARTLYPNAAAIRAGWADPGERAEIIRRLEERGLDFAELAAATRQPDADPFDLLCHVAFNAPLRTRRERAERLRKDRKEFFDRYAPGARAVLHDLLEKYAEHGTAQFAIPDVLKVPPISDRGNVLEIVQLFGGAENLRAAVNELQTLLYAA